MDRLPLEMINEIASYLKGKDLISFSMVNTDCNSLLSKRAADENEKYKLDKYVNHNRLVSAIYHIIDIKNYQYKRKVTFYKRCVLCGEE